MLDDHTLAYLDVLGSGAETIAHLRENRRIVVMFCAFDGPPQILRLHGRGEVILPSDPRFAELITRCAFEDGGVPETRRTIIVIEVTRIATSCGYGVPLMAYEGCRPHAVDWGNKKLDAGGLGALDDYQREKNTTSIDGLPALGRVDHTTQAPEGRLNDRP